MLPELFDLKGQNAVVAGRGGARTRALASALMEAHAAVALVVPASKSGDEVAESLRGAGAILTTIAWEAGDLLGLRKSVEQAVSELGAVDILVNDLAVEFAKPFVEITPDEWRRAIDLNLSAVFYSCQAVAEHMAERKRGRIINVASGLGARAVVNETAYCAAMGGLLQLTRALGLELVRDNIRVNAIAPGWVVDSPDALPDNIRRYIPMRRWGRPEDLGGLLVFLASGACGYTTGETVFVDGGIMTRT